MIFRLVYRFDAIIIAIMEQNAHIFTPQDNTLSERVRAYLRVSLDMSQFNERRTRLSDDLLGDKEDVAKAYEILQNSLNQAYNAITDKEIITAQNEGLLSAEEVRDFLQGRRVRELESLRENSEQLSENHTLRR